MKQSVWKSAWQNFLLYTLDMCIAIAGFVYGFGLEVKNWWVLFGLCLFSRWTFHVVTTARIYTRAIEQATEKKHDHQTETR